MTRLFSLFLVSITTASACGPWFPEAYVLRNDAVFYAPPEVGFGAELRTMIPDAVPHAAVFEEPARVEGLEAVLTDWITDEAERAVVLAAYVSFRAELNAARHYLDRQPYEYYVPDVDMEARTEALDTLAALRVPEGLPQEYTHYLEGALAYYCGDGEAAAHSWEAVLALPKEQRRGRSVMAAYMLGKIADQKAPRYYQLVRTLADEGFVDTQGLAAASYGREAQYYLRKADRVSDASKPYSRAIDLYLKQWAAGYGNAEESLSITAGQVWEQVNDAELAALLRAPHARAVLTAYLLTHCWGERADTYRARLRVALPSSKELSMEEAGRFALMEYQQNNMSATRLWLDYADPKDALALWVRSKLLLREGQLEEGRALMETLTAELAANGSDWGRVDTSRAWAELGLLLLQQERFVEAANCFYHSGSWEDCAYLLERLLLADELIEFVRTKPRSDDADGFGSFDAQALTARRLMREGRFQDALEFFDDEMRAVAGRYIAAMQAASDASAEPAKRARAYWTAARLLRDYGLTLVGSEFAPDFAWLGGSYEWSDIYEDRQANNYTQEYQINQMTWEESKRAEATKTQPNKRFHYRFRAALLAELAAGLLPNDDVNAARIYCVAGDWLRLREPEAADRLYKLLVVRCPNTALGAAAAKVHWFPEVELDAIEPFAGESH